MNNIWLSSYYCPKLGDTIVVPPLPAEAGEVIVVPPPPAEPPDMF